MNSTRSALFQRAGRARLFVAAFLALHAAAFADDPPRKINYKDDLSAVFNARCNACHNQDKKKGGLILDSFASLMQGGASGKIVEPGDPDNSRLFLLVSHEEEPKMPPNADRIPDAELALIKKWIEAGAPETSGSVVAMKEKPKLDFKLDPSAIGKPAGAPAMPTGLSTEPAVVSARPNAITALAHSPWAPLAAVAGHKQVLLYQTQTQKLIGVLPFPEGIVETLKFTLDGGWLLAAGGRGGQSGRVVVWDVTTGERLMEIGKEYDTVLAADISPDRGLIALGGPSKVLRVYDTSTNELVYECKKHTEWVTAVAFSPDGVLVASGDRNGGLVVWEAPNGREFHDLRGHTAMITSLDWRLDSNVLASSSEDGTIRLWEMQNGGNIKGWGAHGGGAQSVRFAKDGRLVSTGRDRLTKIWDQNGNVQKQLDAFNDVALRAVFTHDDQAVAAGDFSGEVRIYELKEGKRAGGLIANPLPVSLRLEQASAELARLQSEAEAAEKELASLQNQVQAQAQAVATAQAALDQAHAAARSAQAALASAQQEYQIKQATEFETAKAASAANQEAYRAYQLRYNALRDLYAKSDAAGTSRWAYLQTHSERERLLMERAEAALLEATTTLATRLPQWSQLMEAPAPLEAAHHKATTAYLLIEASLPALRLGLTRAEAAIAPGEGALAAAQSAKQAAEQAVAAKQPTALSLRERAAAIKAEVDQLAAEKTRLDTRRTDAQASVAPGR